MSIYCRTQQHIYRYQFYVCYDIVANKLFTHFSQDEMQSKTFSYYSIATIRLDLELSYTRNNIERYLRAALSATQQRTFQRENVTLMSTG